MSLSIFLVVGEKGTVALSPEHIHRKNTKISISLKHSQFKVISYIKKVKNTPYITHQNICYCSNGALPIKESYNSQKNCNQKFLNTTRTWQIQCLLYFTSYCEFLNLPLYRVCTRYWHKTRNFTVIDPEILSMKKKMTRFALVSHFAPGYSIQYKW